MAVLDSGDSGWHVPGRDSGIIQIVFRQDYPTGKIWRIFRSDGYMRKGRILPWNDSNQSDLTGYRQGKYRCWYDIRVLCTWDDRIPDTLVIPSVSSENRVYMQIGYVGKNIVVTNLAFAIYDAEPWVFGLISSKMHNLWIRTVFGFQLAGVIYNDEKTRQAITKEQMKKFLKFVHDDNVYCKYYEVFYILFHTGMRISEFCGLTLKDIDMQNRVIDINHQLQRTSWGEYVIEPTKTNAGTRKLPMTEDVYQMFKAIIEDRPTDLPEIMVAGYCGFLFRDKNGMPEVAMHWEHRFNHSVKRYNDIFKVQMPNITPHVCRHTYCSNMARARMNPKTLQYLMGHSDISVTMNVYTHLGFDDAKDEMIRLEELEAAKKEVEKVTGEKPITQKMFKAI